MCTVNEFELSDCDSWYNSKELRRLYDYKKIDYEDFLDNVGKDVLREWETLQCGGVRLKNEPEVAEYYEGEIMGSRAYLMNHLQHEVLYVFTKKEVKKK